MGLPYDILTSNFCFVEAVTRRCVTWCARSSWAQQTCQRLPAVEPTRLLPALRGQPASAPPHAPLPAAGQCISRGWHRGPLAWPRRPATPMLLKTCGAQESALQTAGAHSLSAILRSTCRSYARCSTPGRGCSCAHRWHVTTASGWTPAVRMCMWRLTQTSAWCERWAAA